MWFFGDFNLYVGAGPDRELKALPMLAERLLGSLGAGVLFSAAATGAFWVTEEVFCGRLWRRNGPTVEPRVGWGASFREMA
jgi:hypothetical protein